MSTRHPNLFIVGVAKAGTTSLYALLSAHPDVYMSPRKEPHFLAAVSAVPRAAYTLNRVESQSEYLRLFRSATTERVLGEASTTYWWNADATARRIEELSPEASVIIMLRDPVARAYSHYLNDLRDGIEDRPFADTVPAQRPGERSLRWGDPLLRTELGFYSARLQEYLNVFGDRTRVIVYEDFFASPEESLPDVLRFLGLARSPAGSTDEQPENPHRLPRGALARSLLSSRVVRRLGRVLLPADARRRAYEALFRPAAKPKMDSGAAQRLRDLYRADTARVEAILGGSLPWSTSASAAEAAEAAVPAP